VPGGFFSSKLRRKESPREDAHRHPARPRAAVEPDLLALDPRQPRFVRLSTARATRDRTRCAASRRRATSSPPRWARGSATTAGPAKVGARHAADEAHALLADRDPAAALGPESCDFTTRRARGGLGGGLASSCRARRGGAHPPGRSSADPLEWSCGSRRGPCSHSGAQPPPTRAAGGSPSFRSRRRRGLGPRVLAVAESRGPALRAGRDSRRRRGR